jgi:hypothetical protein
MRILRLLLAAAVLGGCAGRAGEPPKPDRALSADYVSIAGQSESRSCGHFTLALRSGKLLDVVGLKAPSDPTCPEHIPTKFLLGDSGQITSGALVLVGTHDGQQWLGVVSSFVPTRGCWEHTFNRGDGAYLEGGEGPYLEGGTLHLSSGLVLPFADDFGYVEYPPSHPFPIRLDDRICLNSEGEVEWIYIWIPY